MYIVQSYQKCMCVMYRFFGLGSCFISTINKMNTPSLVNLLGGKQHARCCTIEEELMIVVSFALLV